MSQKIKKIGGSSYIIIPPILLKMAKLKLDDEIKLELKGGGILIKGVEGEKAY